MTGFSELTTDSANIQDAVARFSNPDVEAPKVATAVALSGSSRRRAPKPEDTTVSLLNGYVVPGAAAEARYLLAQRGYATVDGPPGATGNAPWDDQFHTKCTSTAARSGQAAAAVAIGAALRRRRAEAYAAAKQCTGPPVKQPRSCHLRALERRDAHGRRRPDLPQHAGAGSRAHADHPYAARRPLRDRAATASLVRAQKRKVGFPLMVPSVLDRLSSPDSDVPVRTYRIAEDHGPSGSCSGRGLEVLGRPADELARRAISRRAEASTAPSTAAATTSTTRGRSCT